MPRKVKRQPVPNLLREGIYILNITLEIPPPSGRRNDKSLSCRGNPDS